MRVFILAGGLGTRIRSLFPQRPKPMIPVLGRPFLEWQIELLIGQGLRDLVLCVSHLAEQIIQHFGDGAAWGVNIAYSVEATTLGTAGALKNAAALFQDTSLVLNGDTYVAADYNGLVAAHEQQAARSRLVGSLGLAQVADTSRYGRVIVGPDQRIETFVEKGAGVQAGLVNAGVYVFEQAVLDYIPAGRVTSLEREVLPILAADRTLGGAPVHGSFVDMGTPEGYQALERLLQSTLPQVTNLREGE